MRNAETSGCGGLEVGRLGVFTLWFWGLGFAFGASGFGALGFGLPGHGMFRSLGLGV